MLAELVSAEKARGLMVGYTGLIARAGLAPERPADLGGDRIPVDLERHGACN